MKALDLDTLIANRAPAKEVFRAMSIKVWRLEDVEHYKETELEKGRLPIIGVMVNQLFNLFGQSLVVKNGWRIAELQSDGKFWNRGLSQTPAFVPEHMALVRQFFPDAKFDLEYFGKDPVVWTKLSGYYDGRYPTLVYTKIDGKPAIIDPPA